MWKSIKKGFGYTIGVLLGYSFLLSFKDVIMRWGANDDEYMERIKKKDPKFYEELLKYKQ